MFEGQSSQGVWKHPQSEAIQAEWVTWPEQIFLTGFYLHSYALVSSKPLAISCIFAYGTCACYTLIRLGIMMGILGFVYLYLLCHYWQAALSLKRFLSKPFTILGTFGYDALCLVYPYQTG